MQRKRVTIGVELAARPELLLFLDEPTSGLDSDTAWLICTLLRKLADNGQAVLCTVHQPSGNLFQLFDRLLFLVRGKSIYFGPLGDRSDTLIEYFERHGARTCGRTENPAEWLLEITGSIPGSEITTDWAETWQRSPEREDVKAHLTKLKEALSKSAVDIGQSKKSTEFATSFIRQLIIVTGRNIHYDWRTPAYLYAKLFTAFLLVRDYIPRS